MRRMLLLVLLGAAAAHAADPVGTVTLDLVAGESKPITAKPSATVICDDASLVTPEYTPDGNSFALRGLKPGTTLCGVWLPDQLPGGLYRVKVRPAEPPDAGAGDGGVASDAGVADAGRATPYGMHPR